jgi:AcrR family transcriptional regulator
MDQGTSTTKDRLLNATIELIEKEGHAGLTTRSIAAAAGVNIAAINYYYQNKESLIEAALGSSWEHMLGHLRALLVGEPWDARGSLLEIALLFLEGGFRYPSVSRANIFNAAGEPRPILGASIVSFSGELEAKLAALGAQSGGRLHDRTGAFISALLFPAIAHPCLPWLDSESARKDYAANLVDDFLRVTLPDPSSFPPLP